MKGAHVVAHGANLGGPLKQVDVARPDARGLRGWTTALVQAQVEGKVPS